MPDCKSADVSARALDGLLVLDVAGPLGNYCGKLFSNMGADVVLIEPLQGAASRRSAPFIGARKDNDASLVHQYQNTDKRSIAIDLDHPKGQELFRRLAARADAVIESEQPGVMARRGLSYAQLHEVNPALVMTSVTAFGQDGPFAHYKATDLTAMATGGMLYLAGYIDDVPCVACGEQAIGAANLFAGVATLAALWNAELSREGQHVDVSMQESVVLGMENAVQFYDLEGSLRKRTSGVQRLAGTGVFACKDGYVYVMAGGVGSNRFWAASTEWLVSKGVPGAEGFRDAKWTDQAYLATAEAKQRFGEVFNPFVRTLTKAELQAAGRAHRIPIAPINNAKDVTESAQRAHRGYFVSVQDSHGATLRQPGAPYCLSETPWQLNRCAPKLGEHTEEILASIGVSLSEQEVLLNEGVVL